MVLLVLFSCLMVIGRPADSASGAEPHGWFIAGSAPQEYEIGRDRQVKHGGAASGFIKSKAAKIAGFGTLMQAFKADAYRGKRLRLSGYVRSKEIGDWAGLWMRVDGPRETLSFDNMQTRPIKGSTDWTRHEIVLDVPQESVGISFGVLLNGTGQVWVDDYRFEVVGRDVPTTGDKPEQTPRRPEPPEQPANLDFEE
jgi:hypothetical protein